MIVKKEFIVAAATSVTVKTFAAGLFFVLLLGLF